MQDGSVPSSRSPESYARMAAPALRSAWLLRAAALVAVLAALLGGIILPGLRGNASDAVITRWERVSSIGSYTMGLLLVGLIVTGAVDLTRPSRISGFVRGPLIAGATLVTFMVVPAFVRPLSPIGTILMVVGTCVVAGAGAAAGVRAPHTRALSLVLASLALAGLVRLVGWQIAYFAGDSLRAYSVARGFATAGVVLEGLGQMAAVAWLGTRGRWTSQLSSTVALAIAFVLVWGAGQGRHAQAATWQTVLHTALGYPAPPEPYGLSSLAAFFAVASVLLALAAIAQTGQLAAVTCSLALVLLGRGVFDVPLRALAACAGALWTALAMTDDRAMWTALVQTRKDKAG